MMRPGAAWLVLLVGWNLASTAFGANATVVLKDGSVVKGEITKMDAQAVSLSGSVGDLTIPLEQVDKIESETRPAVTGGKSAQPSPAPNPAGGQPPDLKTEALRHSVVFYDENSIYNHRVFGLGFALGESTGFGLSALFRVSPFTLVVTGVPLPEGYNAGAQLQCDVLTRGSRRVYLCAGASHQKTGEYYSRGMGMGAGFGWMAANLIGFSGNVGIAQGNSTGYLEIFNTSSDSGAAEGSYHLNLNIMIHFYVL
jgi:hypothetical protein